MDTNATSAKTDGQDTPTSNYAYLLKTSPVDLPDSEVVVGVDGENCDLYVRQVSIVTLQLIKNIQY